jgi:uncharacterized protein (DUF2147 family)
MKRIVCLVALMALSSTASARGSYSFSFRGHRVHIASHCRSLSCVSVSGIGNRRDRDNDVTTTANDPSPTPTPAPAPAQAPAPPPQARPAPAQPLVAPARPPLVTAQSQAAPVITRAPTLAAASNRPAEITSSTPPAPPPAVGFDTAKPQQPSAADKGQARPHERLASAQSGAPVVHVAQESEGTAVGTPLGNWQTDGKNGGLVRIEACGTALCGYTLDPSTGAKGEPVLVNMKPKNDTQWAGNVYSRSSGNSYYGTLTLKRKDDTLRVEACALGRFFCSGNSWTRAPDKGDELVSSQHAHGEPRS